MTPRRAHRIRDSSKTDEEKKKTMRTYMYQAIIVSCDGFRFAYYVRGKNKKDAIKNMSIPFPHTLEKIQRVNVNR